MDNQTLVQLVSALAWPITVIIVAFMLRLKIKKLSADYPQLSYGDIKAEDKHSLNKPEQM